MLLFLLIDYAMVIWIGFAVAIQAYHNHDMGATFDMTHWQHELTVSLPLLGAIIGCLIVLLGMGDYVSRRGILFIAGALYLSGCLFVGMRHYWLVLAI
jgi:uncharacterized membrane protein